MNRRWLARTAAVVSGLVLLSALLLLFHGKPSLKGSVSPPVEEPRLVGSATEGRESSSGIAAAEGSQLVERAAETGSGLALAPSGSVEDQHLPTVFTVAGLVTFSREEDREPLLVSSFGEILGVASLAGKCDVREDGSWGPVELPVAGFDHFRVRVEGQNTIPQEEVVLPEPAGTEVRVDFDVRVGEELVLVVFDENQEILLDAHVDLRWQNDNFRFVQKTFRPDDKGYVRSRGLPPGVVVPMAGCPGYVTAIFDYVIVPVPPSTGISLQLLPAGKFLGRVTHELQPVRDFDVVFWHAVSSASARRIPVRGGEDGEFALEDLLQGPVVIQVLAPGLAPSEPYLTEPGDLASEEPIPFVLRDAARGRGKVIDARTGDPVGHARVQPLVDWEGDYFLENDVSSPVSADGTFEVAAFAHGEPQCRVEAPGYGAAVARGLTGPDGRVDFGLIRLSPAQALDVALIAEEGTDFSQYTLSVRGARRLSERPFSHEGLLHLEGVSAGPNMLCLWSPGLDMRTMDVNLLPGKDWTVEIPLHSPGILNVEVLPAVGDETLPDCRLRLTYHDGEHRRIVQQLRIQNGTARAFGVTRDRVIALVYTADSKPLVSRTIEMRGQDEVSVTLQIGGFGARLRVIDGEGVPVPNVSAYLTSADGDRDFFSQTTDANGECSIAGVPEEHVLVYLEHPERGSRPATPARLSTDPEELVELVLGEFTALEVQLLYGSAPAPGVRAMLLDASGRIVVYDLFSNESGLVSWPSLERGTYLVRINEPGHWYQDGRVSTEDTHRPVPLRIYRLTSLELELRNAEGLPVAGQAITLFSRDLGADVGGWVGAKLVDASGAGLRTDGTGLLRLDRLPEGVFTWSLTTAAGEVLGGTCEAVAGAVTRARISVP